MIITAKSGFSREHAKAMKRLSFDHSLECYEPNADLRFYLQHRAKFYFTKNDSMLRSYLYSMKSQILEFTRKQFPAEVWLQEMDVDRFRLNTDQWFEFQRKQDITHRIRPAFFFCKERKLRKYARKYIGLLAGEPNDLMILDRFYLQILQNDYSQVIQVFKQGAKK